MISVDRQHQRHLYYSYNRQSLWELIAFFLIWNKTMQVPLGKKKEKQKEKRKKGRKRNEK